MPPARWRQFAQFSGGAFRLTEPLTAMMIVLSLLDDVPIMTIAYDNTPVSAKPIRWQITQTERWFFLPPFPALNPLTCLRPHAKHMYNFQRTNLEEGRGDRDVRTGCCWQALLRWACGNGDGERGGEGEWQ